MSDLFGGSLVIRDAFTSTFASFGGAISSATNGFNMFTQKIGESERANRRSMDNMQESIDRLAQNYVRQGYTISQAMQKATSEAGRLAPDSGNKWIDAFGRIKQSGTDAFEGISKKMENFSNSTLGTITKLTAGFASFEGIKKGLVTGFETGSDYQNLRLILNNLYKSDSTGAKKFTMATDFASNSIWQEKDVVRSLAMMKGSGLKDDKNSLTEMSDLGSYEKSMGVGDINTATRAYMEMTVGRWNMMTMELGIKREDVEKFAQKNNMQKFDNKNGEITNKPALETAFKGFIDQRGLTGLSDKMKDTFTGKMSTLKDNINKSLAELIGVGNDGAVKTGSIFYKFCNGISTFTTKIQEFSKTAKFDKISQVVGDIGGAISNGFSYLMDHPEIAEDLLKLSVGIWALGKVSAVVGMFTTIAGAFGEGGLLAVLAPIAPEIFALAGSLLALSSIVSPDGTLHNGISWLLGKIPFIGSSLQECFDEGSKVIYEFFTGIWDWIKEQFGFGTTKTDTASSGSEEKWYGANGKEIKATDKDLQYKTATSALKDGTITKASANKSVTNKTDIHLQVGTIKETADVDELMDTVTKRMDKYSQTRNNLEE